MNSYVYVITNLVNGKQYVGKANDPRKRMWKHVEAANAGREEALYRAIRKHGRSAFVMDVVAAFQTEADALAYERELIASADTKGAHGYNMTAGGDGVLNPSDDVRRKMSAKRIAVAAAKRNAVCPKDRRPKKCRFHAGGRCLKRPISSETRAKMREKKLGHTKSPETLAKMSTAHKGRVHSKEWVDKIAASLRARGERIRAERSKGVSYS